MYTFNSGNQHVTGPKHTLDHRERTLTRSPPPVNTPVSKPIPYAQRVIPGTIIISAISDRLESRKLPLVGASGLAAVFVFIFMAAPAGTPTVVFMVLNFLIGFCFSFWVLLFSMVPETLPRGRASIGLGLVNGMGTIEFSFFAPLYGYFVDVTGGYSVSNRIIQSLILLMPVIFYIFIKESYGGIQEDV